MVYRPKLQRGRRGTSVNEKAAQAMLAALKTVHSLSAPTDGALEGLERQRQSQNILGRLVSPELGYSWEPFQLGSMPMAWARPECGHDRHHVVLYCHAAATPAEICYARVLASKLAKSTGYEVLTLRIPPRARNIPIPPRWKTRVAAWDYLMELGYAPGTWCWPVTRRAEIWRWF